MDCSNVRKILPEHIEGNSPPEQRAMIEEHLQSCGQCMLYAAEMKKTIETLQGLEEIEPPAWLTAKVMNKIRTEAMPKKGWRERLFFPLHIKLPLEAFAALLITVAAIFIYKNMGPELQQMELQPQAPVMKSMPAEPEKEMQKKEMQPPQRLQEEAKHKDSFAGNESREITTFKEKKSLEQTHTAPAISPIPAPASSSAPAPAPSSAMRQIETGKASGMAARDEVMQRAAPAAPRSELSAENKAEILATVTLTVKALDAANKEIEAYISRIGGELKTLEQSESRIIITVKLDPAKTKKFFAHLNSLGTIKEDHHALSMQSGLFKLIVEKQ
jgi:hypothetical protein